MEQTRQGPPDHPFGDALGIRWLGVAEGRAEAELPVAGHLMNPYGVLHGGVLFSIADTCMGAALYSRLEAGEICSTIEIKINFLRPVGAGTLTCESQVVHRGRTTALLEATVYNEGKMAARAQGTFAIRPR